VGVKVSNSRYIIEPGSTVFYRDGDRIEKGIYLGYSDKNTGGIALQVVGAPTTAPIIYIKRLSITKVEEPTEDMRDALERQEKETIAGESLPPISGSLSPLRFNSHTDSGSESELPKSNGGRRSKKTKKSKRSHKRRKSVRK
jgi:hypothetical protein